MLWTRRRKIALWLLLLLAVAIVLSLLLMQKLFADRYAGQPQVVGLPAGYQPRAQTDPYSGPHPSRKARPSDPYRFPIALGASGPVMPTYAESLDYPYACRSEISGLGQPLVDNQDGAGIAVYALNEAGEKTDRIVGYSKDCSLNTAVHYLYRNKKSGEFLALTDQSGDIDEVSINGQSVPFVVRLETGTINRHIYVVAVLRGPDDSREQADLTHWNQKLIYQLRGGVGIGRRQGNIPLDYIPRRRQAELAQGFAIAYSTGNQTSNSYDIELAEDTMARVKRQFVARYGEPKYMVGIGSSGGALQQYLIGQNRPGLLDGGIAMYSYPDMVTQTTRVMDCELLEYYFDVIDADNEKWQRWSQRSWIEGFNARDDVPNFYERLQALQAVRLGKWPSWSRGQTECTQSWRNLTPQIANPHYTYFASLFAPDVLSKTPFTYWDNLKRVFGTDADGFGRRTYDNVGVQYGLKALKQGNISVAEFIKLNDAIGGWKSSNNMRPEKYWQYAGAQSSLADLSVWSNHNMMLKRTADRPAQRSEGDEEAIAAAYRSGQVFLGELSMPVIDVRHYLEPELNMHHSLQSFAARLRMFRGQGHADTQLVWIADRPYSPVADAIDVLDRWLEMRQEDPALTVAEAKPADASDRCYYADGAIIASGDGVWDGVWNDKTSGACMQAYPIFSNPRIVAGDDYAGDVFKCHLQSVDEAIAGGVYAPIDVSDDRTTLRRVFPDGVCDYSRGDAARPADLFARPANSE